MHKSFRKRLSDFFSSPWERCCVWSHLSLSSWTLKPIWSGSQGRGASRTLHQHCYSVVPPVLRTSWLFHSKQSATERPALGQSCLSPGPVQWRPGTQSGRAVHSGDCSPQEPSHGAQRIGQTSRQHSGACLALERCQCTRDWGPGVPFP